MPRTRDTSSTTKRVKLKPADPFELIRWLARSQSDPRKAVAELVQNSLDAQARRVHVVRRRIRKGVSISIRDDGAGVIPELPRADALHYLATHIGHSRKRGLSPQERAEQVVAGQYGVGLLGFWSVGERLELRTRVGGSELMALRLAEDSREARIVSLPVDLDAPMTFTEAIVEDLHASASRTLSGKRLSEYLAAELRGQLLREKTEITIEDRLVRGRGQRVFPVKPRPFVGERMAVPSTLPIPDHPPAHIELYFAGGDEAPAIQVACAGTLVADDIGELQTLGHTEAPWVGCGLCGLVDFAGFTIPPGTRRGVLPDAAAAAFAAALTELAPAVQAEVDRRKKETSAATDRKIMRDLRKALRGFHRRLPQYDFPVAHKEPGMLRPPGEASRADSHERPGTVHTEPLPTAGPVTAELFPPGPMASVALKPTSVKLTPGRERRVRADPRDVEGRSISEGVTFSWTVSGCAAVSVSVEGAGRTVKVVASHAAVPGISCTLHLDAVMDGALAHASLPVSVSEPKDKTDDDTGFGVVDPQLVSDPAGQWRSRLVGDSWQVNESHEDYLGVRGEARSRMRYLLSLLAKEMVLRSYGRPGDEALLEHMVEILAHAEKNLRGK